MTQRALAAIDRSRLAATTLDLVNIPSPSGQEEAMAWAYADLLGEAGLEVEVDHAYPESPSVIGRSPGRDPVRSLQLAGHLDTVSSGHTEPTFDGEVIHGRGAADMKSGLAAIVETVRALGEADALAASNLLVTAYGQHEETIGDNPLHAPLIDLLQRGNHGAACIIPEGPHEHVPIAGRGSIIFEVGFSGPDTSTHEVLGSWPRHRNPVMAAVTFVEALRERSRTWTLVDELAGPESFFIGRLCGGDLYNRVAVRAVCEGTRRYPPGRTFDQARKELIELAEAAAAAHEVLADPRIAKSGQPFRLDVGEPIIQALRTGHLAATGTALDLGAIPYSADGSHVIEHASIPAVYHGTNSTTAHADKEFVALDDIERCTRVLVAAAIAYGEQAVADVTTRE